MHEAAGDLEFEEAARLRDEIRRIEETDLGLSERGNRLRVSGVHGYHSAKKGNRRKHKSRSGPR